MKTFGIALKIFLVFTLLTGVIYPLLVTGIAQAIFPHQANGSLILKNNKIIGSELIGQQSDSIIYFTSRPSAIGNNPIPSGGSNYGLTSKKLKDQVQKEKINLSNSTILMKMWRFRPICFSHRAVASTRIFRLKPLSCKLIVLQKQENLIFFKKMS